MPRPRRFVCDTISPQIRALYVAVTFRLQRICGSMRVRRCSTGAANLNCICRSIAVLLIILQWSIRRWSKCTYLLKLHTMHASGEQRIFATQPMRIHHHNAMHVSIKCPSPCGLGWQSTFRGLKLIKPRQIHKAGARMSYSSRRLIEFCLQDRQLDVHVQHWRRNREKKHWTIQGSNL